MENWIFYASIAAFLIAMRDIFTKKLTTKYSTVEHLLYYYVFCGFFIIIFALYKSFYEGENIKFIETEDLWIYIVMTSVSAIIISPCQFLSLKDCDNPGKSKAIVNLNSVIAFFLAIYFIRGTKFQLRTVLGITIAALGVYLII